MYLNLIQRQNNFYFEKLAKTYIYWVKENRRCLKPFHEKVKKGFRKNTKLGFPWHRGTPSRSYHSIWSN